MTTRLFVVAALGLGACSSKPADRVKPAAGSGSAARGSATPSHGLAVGANGLPVLPPAAPAPTAPDGLPTAPSDAPNPAAVEFGELLFFDGRLASDGKTTCATCHGPERDFAGTGLQATAAGAPNLRQAPSLTNSGWQSSQAWDGRFPTVSAMLGAHIQGQLGRSAADAVAAVAALPLYRAHAKRLAGDSAEPTAAIAIDALSAYVLTRFSGDARWDKIERGELPEDATLRAGYTLFTGKAQCGTCHPPPMYSDFAFHRLGLIKSPDPGRGKVDPAMQGAFMTQGLRGAAARKAFFHDGSARTLAAAIDWHLDGGRGQGADPSIIDPALTPVALSPAEREQLQAFVTALTPATAPASPPIQIP